MVRPAGQAGYPPDCIALLDTVIWRCVPLLNKIETQSAQSEWIPMTTRDARTPNQSPHNRLERDSIPLLLIPSIPLQLAARFERFVSVAIRRRFGSLLGLFPIPGSGQNIPAYPYVLPNVARVKVWIGFPPAGKRLRTVSQTFHNCKNLRQFSFRKSFDESLYPM